MNLFSKISKHRIGKAIVILFLVSSLTFAPIQAPKASALWGEIPAQVFNSVMRYLEGMINGLITGALKTAAVKAINGELSSIIGGSSSQEAKFITDWKDYLIDQPRDAANAYMNDYLSTAVTQGRGSISSYISTTSASLFSMNYEGFGKDSFSYGLAMKNPSYGKFSYIARADGDTSSTDTAAVSAQTLVDIGTKLTTGQTDPTITYNGEDITQASNGYANLNLYLSGINNQWGLGIHAQEKYQAKLKEEQVKAQTKGVAGQGFSSTSDLVSTPGILAKEAMAGALNMGNQMLAAADDAAEIATAVVQALLVQAIEEGIGQAGEAIQKEVQSVQDSVNQKVNEQAEEAGIGSLYISR